MTTPRRQDGRSAGSQVHGLACSPLASSPADCAWNVNFNNGNADYNNRNNQAFVRPVRVARASECQGERVSFQELHTAWQIARRRKIPSDNQIAFETRWIDNLIELQQQLNDGAWSPRPTTCFIATRPKAREIHAPDFTDRVVHHWLVPRIEALFEPRFIHDSFSNRAGKGTHAAVDRLRDFVRQVHSGQGGGWYLQLDVRNFFNSIHRPTLYALLRDRLQRADAPLIDQRTTHSLLRHSAQQQGVVYRCTPAERARVPLYKRLEHAAPGCGLPIGNLSSQFFANTYLDVLDQFVKRELRAPRYVRYVDDFVLVHRDREQLAAWQAQIAEFLRDRLRLELKPDIRLRPLSAGIDFLGYVLFPTHTRVRRRVVRHAFAAIAAAKQFTSERRQSVLASYVGHFAHANAFGLTQKLIGVTV